MSSSPRPQTAPVFRSGLPMKLSAWMTLSSRGASSSTSSTSRRRAFSYVRLSGEVLSIATDQFALPVVEHDVRGARIEVKRKEFKVILADGAGVVGGKMDSAEEVRTWVDSLREAGHRVFGERYEVGGVVGVGGRSVVRYCKGVVGAPVVADVRGDVFVVKVVKRGRRGGEVDALEYRRLERERQVVTMLSVHANVVQTVDVFYSVERLHVVMEEMRGGTLEKLLEKHGGRLPEPHVRAVMRDLLKALASLHSQSVVHRDVRPGSLFLSKKKFPMEIALGGFGEAAVVEGERVNRDVLEGMVGEPEYMAAEMVRREKYGPAVDMWSAGIVMYRCIAGEGPFGGGGTRAVFDRVRKGVVNFDAPVWHHISDGAKSLIRQLLNPDSHKRISAVAAGLSTWVLQRPARRQRSITTSTSSTTSATYGGFVARAGSADGAVETRARDELPCYTASSSLRLPRTSSRPANPKRLIPSATAVAAAGPPTVVAPAAPPTALAAAAKAATPPLSPTSRYDGRLQLPTDAQVISRYDGRLVLSPSPGPDDRFRRRPSAGGSVGSGSSGIHAFSEGADVRPDVRIRVRNHVPSVPSMVSLSSGDVETEAEDDEEAVGHSEQHQPATAPVQIGAITGDRVRSRFSAGLRGHCLRVGHMVEMLEAAESDGEKVESVADRHAASVVPPGVDTVEPASLQSHPSADPGSSSISSSSSSSSSTFSRGTAPERSDKAHNQASYYSAGRLRNLPDNYVPDTPTRSSSVRTPSSSSGLADDDEKARLVFTPSLRKIQESGLQAMARENPSRMRRIMSSNVMQQQLSTLLPYRRKLVITSRAFVAVFRLLALVRGHSLTRQLGTGTEARNWGEHVNDIINQRKDFHESPTIVSSPRGDTDHFMPRIRGEAGGRVSELSSRSVGTGGSSTPKKKGSSRGFLRVPSRRGSLK